MTRADKFEQVFGYRPATDEIICNENDWCGENDACKCCLCNSENIGKPEDWWNAEYNEPTTKNDIGTDIIKNLEQMLHIESVSICKRFTSQEITTFTATIKALQSLQSNEPILDKVKAEIMNCLKALDEIEKSGCNIYRPNEMSGRRLTYQQCLEFIDKYKAESEET